MSYQPDNLKNGSNSSPYVPSTSPAILIPAEVIGNIVSRANELITGHREWLSNLPVQKEQAKRQMAAVPQARPATAEGNGIFISSTIFTITANPSSFTTSLPSQGSPLQGPPLLGPAAASASITSLQSALSSANNALASATQSASLALATASASLQAALNSASIQSQSALAATQSASIAIASAQSSATQAIAAVQSSASASILLANEALSSVQSSASAAVRSANSLASGAQLTATNAIAEAQASISAVASQATAAIASSKISAMNLTTFILVITFSVIGSSIITAIFIFLIIRFRRKRRVQKQDEMKTSIHRRRHESDESAPPSLSEFPLPNNRTRWSSRMSARLSERGSLRNRAADRGDAGYWPRGNERVSATDRERAAWQRSPSSLREMIVPIPAPLEARKTWAFGQAPQQPEPAANRNRASEPYIQANPGLPGINGTLVRQTWSPTKDKLPQSQSTTIVATPGFGPGRSVLSRDGPDAQPPNMTIAPLFAPGTGSPSSLNRPPTSERPNMVSTPVFAPHPSALSMNPPVSTPVYAPAPLALGMNSAASTPVFAPAPLTLSKNPPIYGDTVMVRKNTLTYDAEHPDQPPKFATWLEQSIRSVSPFRPMEPIKDEEPESNRTSAALGRQSARFERRGLFEGSRDSDGSAIIGTAM